MLMLQHLIVLTRGRLSVVLFLLLLMLGGARLCAQELTVEAPNAVYAGQPFRIVFTAEGKLEEFTPPVWGALTVLQGPMESTMQHIEMINGRISRSLRTSQTYICRLNDAGVYHLPAATAVVDGTNVKSHPADIEVVDNPQAGGMPNGGAPASRGNAPTPRDATTAQGNDISSDLLVAIQLSKNEVYQGEPVVATLKIFTRLDLVSFEDFRFPDFKGFWAKEIETPRQISFHSEVYNGKQYNAGVLRQYVLYPQKSGELEIEPLKAVVQYRVRGARQSFFDEFMGTFQTDVRTLTSPSRKLKVLPLPSGAPSSFTGAVGHFDLSAKLDNQDVKTNEAVTYTLTVSGAGNMQLLQKPELRLPSTVEVFPPKMTENYSLRNGVQTGSVSYEFILIPRAPGVLSLPAYEYSYFDPQAKGYKTLRSEAFELNVQADSTQAPTSVAGTISKEDVQYLGQDIRHIYVGEILLQPVGDSFLGSLTWWIVLLLIVVLSLLLWIFLRRRQEMFANMALLRGKRAGSVVRRRLQRVKGYMNQDAGLFYVELERAVWGYFSDKLSIELSELSSDGVRTALAEQEVPEQLIGEVAHIISACEYARYAPSSVQESQESLYTSTLATFESLERWLKQRSQLKK